MSAQQNHTVWTAYLSAGSIAPGFCGVLNTAGTGYVVATAAARAAAGRRSAGIAITAGNTASPAFELQTVGVVPPTVSGLGAGTASWLRVSTTGTLERCTPAGSDDVVGRCDADGTAYLVFGQLTATIVNGGGGGGSTPTGTGLRKVAGGVEDAAASLAVDADIDPVAAIAVSKLAGHGGSGNKTPVSVAGAAPTYEDAVEIPAFAGNANKVLGLNAGATALEHKTIVAGANVTVTHAAGSVTIAAAAGSGEANTASNLGATGARVFTAKSGVDLPFRRLIGSGFISATENANDITFAVTGSLGVANGGTGTTSFNEYGVVTTPGGTGGLSSVAPGTSGNVLTSNGTAWVSSAPAGGLPSGSNGQFLTYPSGSWVAGNAVSHLEIGSGTKPAAGLIRVPYNQGSIIQGRDGVSDVNILSETTGVVTLGHTSVWGLRLYSWSVDIWSVAQPLNLYTQAGTEAIRITSTVGMAVPILGLSSPYSAHGSVAVAVPNADVTLSASQYSRKAIRLYSSVTLTALRTITLPNVAAADGSYDMDIEWEDAATGSSPNNIRLSMGSGATVTITSSDIVTRCRVRVQLGGVYLWSPATPNASYATQD